MRRPTRRHAGVGILLVALSTVLSGCSVNNLPRFGFPRGVTVQADRILTLWSSSTIAALAVGVFVWGLIFWAAIRYRRRPDAEEMPPQVSYSLPIEILYTVVPFLIIAVLFFYTAVDETYVNAESKRPDIQISVLAFKWNWQFGYVGQQDRNGNFVQTVGSSDEIPVLVLPVNKTVLFTETSPDVVHSFWVPEFLFKRDVIPGRTNSFEVTVTRTGSFVGHCAEFCGAYHAFMNFEVRAVSQSDFTAFLTARKQGMTTADALRAIGQPPFATTTRPFGQDRGQLGTAAGSQR